MTELAALTAMTSTWDEHVSAADAQLAIAALARLAGDRARTHAAATAARDHLARAVSIIGVDPGFVARRRAWATALAGG